MRDACGQSAKARQPPPLNVCRRFAVTSLSFYPAAADDFAAAGKHHVDCLRKNPMLLFEDPRGKRFDRVFIEHWNHGLFNDGTVIQCAGDEMYRAAAELHAVLQSLFLDVESGE